MHISLAEPGKNEFKSVMAKGKKQAQDFAAKFSRDGTMFAAAGLAYSLISTIVPFGIALLAVLGFTVGSLDPQATARLIERLQNALPHIIASQNILQPAITQLAKSAGILAVFAVITAIFSGSQLFIAIENCFDIIYRTGPRPMVRQYVMALSMMLVFLVLTPLMVVASSLPAIILSLIQNSALLTLPGIAQFTHNGVVVSIGSWLGGTLVAWILFEAIYMVVPNQPISLKHSWPGALVAAVLLELFLALFPFYITHFMNSYTGTAGFAVIFLVFLYYFAVILLLGAQINAFFIEKIGPLPDMLATVLHTTLQPRTPPPAPAPAPPVVPAIEHEPESANKTTSQLASKKRKRRIGSLVEALAGTVLAFLVTLARLRRKSYKKS